MYSFYYTTTHKSTHWVSNAAGLHCATQPSKPVDRVIVAPYVGSVDHVFAYLYTLDEDLECPMDYETSLLPNVFP